MSHTDLQLSVTSREPEGWGFCGGGWDSEVEEGKSRGGS